MVDNDSKPDLPISMILGASDYSKIKTDTKPKLGQPGEPVGELTMLGWTIIAAGEEEDLSSVYFAKSSAANYDQLCSLDVLGLQDQSNGSQQLVYQDFKDQLRRSNEGWYETGLLWKPSGDAPLPTNESNSLGRLSNLLRKLKRDPEVLDQYSEIIQEQLREGVVEKVTEKAQGREYYIPHKPVIRKTAESTKMRIVYDASAKVSDGSCSLNDCLETGPPLQNLLWNVLIRNRLKPIALSADIKKAFLQIRIRPKDRDSLRFHWFKDKEASTIEVLRFTRALFGLVQSPFLLGATIQEHLNSLHDEYPSEVEEIQRSLYVDDIITGGDTRNDVLELKGKVKEIFGQAKFDLHKWHSNVPDLEENEEPRPSVQSYAKDQLGVKPGETKMLGLPWNKVKDTLSVVIPEKVAAITKREILRFLASVYDPLGLVSPVLLVGKSVYRDACDQRLPWDKSLPQPLSSRWQQFQLNLSDALEFPRSLTSLEEPIEAVNLHTFGDSSKEGTAAVVYAVVHQKSGVNQGLVAAKSRLAKKELTIPWLELVSAHMATNLVDNTRIALHGIPVRSVTGWLDSTVALYWIKGRGAYKQFVSNRVKKINAKEYITWRHVGTKENPADLGSRGCTTANLPKFWRDGPEWLSTPDQWPADILTQPSRESEAEAKAIKELFATTMGVKDELDELLEKFSFWKAVRVFAWIARFIQNCKAAKSERTRGVITTVEIETRVKFWIKRATEEYSITESFKTDQATLNLVSNADGLLECRGRIQGNFPIYLPPTALITEKIVHNAHVQSLHGGVASTVAYARQRYWVPRLRQLSKKVIRKCYGCKKFHASTFRRPPIGLLPTDRTTGSVPFEVLGVDYAGPIGVVYEPARRGFRKAYILLFACSLTRAIYLEFLPDQTAENCIKSLKRFIARRGRPKKIYSDNGRTFVATARWLRKVVKQEQLQNFLARQSIVWQFNLSRAPWWGGQFERMVSLVKRALFKSIGRANLRWGELEEVILDVEIAVNNRPLGYVEDDVQFPTLTPNTMLFMQQNLLPEEDASAIEEEELRKRARYLAKCKDAVWSRWTKEYINGLRERHNLAHKGVEAEVKVGDVVLIQSDERNRGKWNIGIVVDLIKGKDGVLRAARLRAGKSYLERAIQHVAPMELSCDCYAHVSEQPKSTLNVEACEYRPRRVAAVAAGERIKEISELENEH